MLSEEEKPKAERGTRHDDQLVTLSHFDIPSEQIVLHSVIVMRLHGRARYNHRASPAQRHTKQT